MKKPRKKRESAAFDPIDIHVGNRVRIRRKLLGMSQTALGGAIGLSFQQVQKYERGANRISSSRLFELSQILDVPVAFFFHDMPEDIEQREPVETPLDDPEFKREALELVYAYFAIENDGKRKSLFNMVKAIARSGNG